MHHSYFLLDHLISAFTFQFCGNGAENILVPGPAWQTMQWLAEPPKPQAQSSKGKACLLLLYRSTVLTKHSLTRCTLGCFAPWLEHLSMDTAIHACHMLMNEPC